MSTDDKSLIEKTLITDEWGELDTVYESLDTLPKGDPTGVVLSTVEGPIMSYESPTRNERLYTRELCEKIINSDYVAEMLETKSFLGEADHPSDDRLNVHFPLVSHAVRDIQHDPINKCYRAKIDILDTPQGRILETLRRYGTLLGISTRGAGAVIMRNGQSLVDINSYIFSTLDIVHLPGLKTARLINTNTANESLNLSTLDKLESPTSILKSYILSESVQYEKYDDESTLDEVIDTAIDNSDEKVLLYARMVCNTLGLEKELISKIDSTLSKLNTDCSDSSQSLVIKALSDELDRSRKEVTELTSKVSDSSNTKTVAQLQNDIEDLISKLDDERLTSTKLRDEINEVEQENEGLLKKIARLAKEKSDLLFNYKKTVSELGDEIDDLVEKLNQGADEYNYLLDEFEEVRLENSKLLESYTSIRCSQLGLEKSLVETHTKDIRNIKSLESILESISSLRYNRLSKPKVIHSIATVNAKPKSQLTSLVESVKNNNK